MALDPVCLSQAASIEPDPWQASLLRSTAPRILLNCSRQSGKSTTTGTLAVHTALYEPHSLVLLLSPTLRQSGELFKKALAVYQALGRPVPADSESALQLGVSTTFQGKSPLKRPLYPPSSANFARSNVLRRVLARKSRRIFRVWAGVSAFSCRSCRGTIILRRVFHDEKRLRAGARPFADENDGP